MPALPLKVLNPHQLQGPTERFLLLPHRRVAHMAEQSGISHILLLLVGWGGPLALPLRRGGGHGLEPLLNEVILGPGPLNGIGPDLYRGGGDLEVPSDVADLGLLNDQAGPEAEIPREEADLDQQGEEGHTPDHQLLGADLVLEHQPDGADLTLEHPQGVDHDPEHQTGVDLGLEHRLGGADLGLEHRLGADLGPAQYDEGLAADRQPEEVAGLDLEPQLGVVGLPLGPQLGVAGLALEPQPDEENLGLGHQQDEGDLGLGRLQDEDPVVEV